MDVEFGMVARVLVFFTLHPVVDEGTRLFFYIIGEILFTHNRFFFHEDLFTKGLYDDFLRIHNASGLAEFIERYLLKSYESIVI
ncbi:hypothetical protein AM1BK_36430 [Neobacillus kokaensis]|uniref:Uncharacterized protein n=1 Tax=Neobacillus kokaensis TaxID=2759023 RepID=A0ABQ3N597_9BACI|nr:hypothetical protein AM1BK_36430 [Neobacillus kokaensis]